MKLKQKLINSKMWSIIVACNFY